jgi:hypothetical protein
MSALQRLKERRQHQKLNPPAAGSLGAAGGDGGGDAAAAPAAHAAAAPNAPASSSSPADRRSGPRDHAASRSHMENDAYMRHFEEGLSLMERARAGSGPDGAAGRRSNASPTGTAGARRPAPQPVTASPASPKIRAARAGPPKEEASSAGHHHQVASQAAASPCWRTGPADPEGAVCQLSERPLLCSAARWQPDGRGGEIVLGSADHGLYVVDAATGKRRRTLYSKACGHKE